MYAAAPVPRSDKGGWRRGPEQLSRPQRFLPFEPGPHLAEVGAHHEATSLPVAPAHVAVDLPADLEPPLRYAELDRHDLWRPAGYLYPRGSIDRRDGRRDGSRRATGAEPQHSRTDDDEGHREHDRGRVRGIDGEESQNHAAEDREEPAVVDRLPGAGRGSYRAHVFPPVNP